MTDRAVYLDHNATSPLRPAAAVALRAALADVGNPSSVHAFGQRARRLVDEVRRQIADAFAAAPEDVVFTSGGTEANNLALLGAAAERLIVSAIEHDSVRAPGLTAGRPVDVLPVDPLGRIDLAALDRLLAGPGRALVSVMYANNETGVTQPVAEVARRVHAAGGLFHCDAVQALGRLPLLPALGDADLVTLSAHKIGGTAGVGALVIRGGRPVAAQLHGGGQERFRRAGTQNVPGIAAFGAALAEAQETLSRDALRLAGLRDHLEAMLVRAGAIAVGSEAERLPNTSALAMPGVKSETQVIALDLAGIAVSAGAACSSGKVTRSHVLQAMAMPAAIADSTVRISLGWSTQERDIERLIAAWLALRHRTGSNRGCDAA